MRAVHTAVALEEATGIATRVIDAGESLPEHGIVVVAGTIPEIVGGLVRDGSTLRWGGRDVAFLNNQNLLAALARREGTDLTEAAAGLEPDLIHGGTTLAIVAMDKTLQQRLAAGTGMTPVVSQRTDGLEETVRIAYEMAQGFGGSVAKPDAASGGTSVVMVDHKHTRDQIAAMLRAGAEKMQAKYGDGWERTCPMGVYEFVDAQPAIRADGAPFRWDMRFEVRGDDEQVEVTPIIARTALSRSATGSLRRRR